MTKLLPVLIALLPMAALTPAGAAQPPRPMNIIAVPGPYLPAPVVTNSTVTAKAPQSRFQEAPVPNRDLYAPLGPRASNDPQLSAGLFTRRDQYRGEGITPNSSAQIDQERRVLPGAGFKLRMPLQQQ